MSGAEVEANNTVIKDSRRAIESVWLAIIFLVPLFFNPVSHEAFYLNKVLLFQFLIIVLVATQQSIVNKPICLT